MKVRWLTSQGTGKGTEQGDDTRRVALRGKSKLLNPAWKVLSTSYVRVKCPVYVNYCCNDYYLRMGYMNGDDPS